MTDEAAPGDPIDFGIPKEFVELAAELDEIAEVIRWYLAQETTWTHDSRCATDIASEPDYPGLPGEHPMQSLLLQPLMLLGMALDHTVAYAGSVRTAHTALSLLTLMRPVVAACGFTVHVLESTDTKERMRRAMNVSLAWNGEALNMAQDHPSGDQFDKRRRKIIKAAQASGFPHTTSPEPKKGRPPGIEWWVGDKPPTEMKVIADLYGSDFDGRLVGYDLYRLLSAATHSQVHALHAVLRPEQAKASGPGVWSAPIAVDGKNLVVWTLAVGAALDSAMTLACTYYGWSPLRWNSIAVPKIAKWKDWATEAPSAAR